MSSLNKVLLMGNLTADPDTRYTGSGLAICGLRLAVNRRYTDRAGNQQDETCFVDIDVFGRQAETCQKYLRKGSPVLVEGRLRFDQWEDRQTGQKRSRLKVVGENIQFMGSPRGSFEQDEVSEQGGGYSESGPRGDTGGGNRNSAPSFPPDDDDQSNVPF